MSQPLGEDERLLTPPYDLRRSAQAPQRVGRYGQALRIMVERQGPLRRRVGEGDPLCEVRPGGDVSHPRETT